MWKLYFLKYTKDEKDSDNFWESALITLQGFIKSYGDNMDLIESYIIDEIKILEIEIPHYKKWSKYYNDNTYISRNYKKKAFKEILENLRNDMDELK